MLIHWAICFGFFQLGLFIAQTVFAAQQKSSEMTEQWQPDIDAIEILLRAGVDKNFIEDAVPEFVLYWRERGDNTSTWTDFNYKIIFF